MSSVRKWIREVGLENGVSLVLLEPGHMDDAILGVTHDGGHVVYDYDRMLAAVEAEHGTEDAIEWVERR